MHVWPLKTPPQIAADGTSLAAGTGGYTELAVPTRADGSKARFGLLTWENTDAIRIKPTSAGEEFFLLGYEQPFLVCLNNGSLYVMMNATPTTVHLTPIEES